MLKGETWPSLLFQKFSRWYSAHSGVFLTCLFTFSGSMMTMWARLGC